MSNLIHILAGRMRSVPAHKQSDRATSDLSLAKWLVELVLIANGKGREAFLNHYRIQLILAPLSRQSAALYPRKHYFPRHSPPRGTTQSRGRPCTYYFLGFDTVSITNLESTVPSQDLLPIVAIKRPTREQR